MVRDRVELFHGELHCAKSGTINIEPIDLFRFHNADTDSQRCFADFPVQVVAEFRIDAFGIVDAFDPCIRSEDNRRGDYRTRHRSDADFIHSRNVAQPLVPKFPLESEHAFKPCALAPRPVLSPFDPPIQPSCSGAWIPAKLPEYGGRRRLSGTITGFKFLQRHV